MKSPVWFVNAGAMPLVGLFLAHLDGAHALVDPAVAIALTVVVLHGHLECLFSVNHLVNALCPHLNQPFLHRLCLLGGDRTQRYELIPSYSHITLIFYILLCHYFFLMVNSTFCIARL